MGKHYDVAALTNQEKQKLRQLEESLGVVLVAYTPTNDANRADHEQNHRQLD